MYAWDPNTPEAQARTLWMGPGKRACVVEADGAVVGSAHGAPDYGGPAAGIADAGFMVDPARGADAGSGAPSPSTSWSARRPTAGAA